MEFFLTIMLNYEALPGKRYYIQYPSLEFCEAGRRKVLEEHRSTTERMGRIGGLRVDSGGLHQRKAADAGNRDRARVG